MRVIRRFIILLLLATTAVAAQPVAPSFVIDENKPFVYLEFDHIGPWKPFVETEPPLGMWIKVVNNSRVPIGVRRWGDAPNDSSLIVPDEIVLPEPTLTITSEGSEIETEPSSSLPGPSPKPKPAPPKPPDGYSCEVCSLITIDPGKSILIALPRNHVSRDWHLRVSVVLRVSAPRAVLGPWIPLDFWEYNIPAGKR
jgi:hypothetical protein